jgi:hypothetical protein
MKQSNRAIIALLALATVTWGQGSVTLPPVYTNGPQVTAAQYLATNAGPNLQCHTDDCVTITFHPPTQAEQCLGITPTSLASCSFSLQVAQVWSSISGVIFEIGTFGVVDWGLKAAAQAKATAWTKEFEAQQFNKQNFSTAQQNQTLNTKAEVLNEEALQGDTSAETAELGDIGDGVEIAEEFLSVIDDTLFLVP